GDLDMVLFSSPKEGWATRSRYGALHTTDGGDSWENLTLPKQGFGAQRCAHAAVGSTYFLFHYTGLSSDGHLYRTDDAGMKWVEVNKKSPAGGYGKVYDMVFADLKQGCLLHNSGKVYTTEDGGKTWQEQKKIESAGSDGARLCFVE